MSQRPVQLASTGFANFVVSANHLTMNQWQRLWTLSWRHLWTVVMHSVQGHRRWSRTSCNECSMLPPAWWATCRSLIAVWWHSCMISSIGWTYQRESRTSLASWCIPLHAWPGTSVPRRPSHPSLWSRLSTSSVFRKPTSAYRTSLSTPHILTSAFLACRPDGLELVTW